MNASTVALGFGRAGAPKLHSAGPAAVSAPRTLWALTGFSAALLLGFAAAALLDARTLGGTNVWLKPAKFALSFVLLYLSLALVVERLSAPVRDSRVLRATLAVMAVATWAELAYIGGQAGRGAASHFNVGTPLAAALYGLMGLGAVSLVVGIGIIGMLAGRDAASKLGPGVRAGVQLGFVLSAVLTLITAGYLSSQAGHHVGTPAPGAATLPLFGWSAQVGDLRPAHFLALHAMQVLPLIGWWLDRRARPARTPLRLAAALYAIATAALFGQALMGWPLWRL